MVIKAKAALEFVIEFHSDIFSDSVIDRVEKCNDYLEVNNLTHRLYFEFYDKTVDAIKQLVRIPLPYDARLFFETLDDNILVFVLLRFSYFEKWLTELGDNSFDVEHGDDHVSLLEYGLFELWVEYEKNGPYFRLN